MGHFNLGGYLHQKEVNIKTLQTFYGISRRVAVIMMDYSISTRQGLKELLRQKDIEEVLKFRGCGLATARDLYDFADMEMPKVTKHKCPACGHKY